VTPKIPLGLQTCNPFFLGRKPKARVATLATPPFFFQLIPLILVIPEITTLNTSCIQDLDLAMNDQIVQTPWEQIPP